MGHGLPTFESITVGDSAATWHAVTENDLIAFAEATGDKNPVHLDDEYAKRTPFKGRIAHGMLTAAYISAIFGTLLPGPGAIYISQTLHFKSPVRPGDTVFVRVTATGKDEEKRRVSFACLCKVEERTALTGEAILWLPAGK